MDKRTNFEILKIVAMFLVLIAIIYAIKLLNSKDIENKVEKKIQTTIEGQSIVEEDTHKVEQSNNSNDNNEENQEVAQ